MRHDHAREILIEALCRDFADTLAEGHGHRMDIARQGHIGFASRTNRELCEATAEAGTQEYDDKVYEAFETLGGAT